MATSVKTETGALKNILNMKNIKSFRASKDCESCEDNLFADIIPNYDEEQGYYKVKNPGWIEVVLNNSQQISYIRFLLWDNRGSAQKRQPSNRKYTYRLLVAEEQNNPLESWTKERGIVWTSLYENSLNPSNGWQEFFFEDGAKDIVAIKIQFFQNSSASNVHKNYSQLVSLQAYSNPTYAIAQIFENEEQTPIEYAPVPTYGFIRNRVLAGGEQEAMNELVKDEIIHEVTNYIRKSCDKVPELIYLCEELEHDSNSSVASNEIEKQIHIFNRSILKPIESYDQRLSRRYRRYAYVTMLIFAFGIVKEVVDIVYLWFECDSPFTIKFWLNMVLG